MSDVDEQRVVVVVVLDPSREGRGAVDTRQVDGVQQQTHHQPAALPPRLPRHPPHLHPARHGPRGTQGHGAERPGAQQRSGEDAVGVCRSGQLAVAGMTNTH